MPFLIDSNVLIDVSRGSAAAINYVDCLTEPWVLSQVTALELIVGARDKRDASFLPARKVALLTTADFKDHRKREVARGVSQRTINYRFAIIRAALNLEAKQTPSNVGKIPYIPFVTVNNTRDGFLEYDDHARLLEELPQSLKALFVVAFHSGCRLGELLSMRWSDVDWRNRIVRLPKTKNGKKRNLPFWGSIEEHLKAQKAYRDGNHPECELLFFWMEEDTEIDHGGIRQAPGTPISDGHGTTPSSARMSRIRTSKRTCCFTTSDGPLFAS